MALSALVFTGYLQKIKREKFNMLVATGQSYSGYQLYRDTDDNSCYTFEDGEYVYWGDCGNTGTPSYPNSPVITSPSVGAGGVLIQPGGSWYNDFLNTLLGLSAINEHQPYIPSTAIPARGTSNPYYPINTNPQNLVNPNAPVAAQAGASFGAFLQQNAMWLLLGVVVFVLYKSGRK